MPRKREQKNPKSAAVHVCARCRELNLPSIPSIHTHSYFNNGVLSTEKEQDQVLLQRILFDGNIPSVPECYICRFFRDRRMTYLQVPGFDEGSDLEYDGFFGIINHISQTELSMFTDRRGPAFGPPRDYWIGDQFGLISASVTRQNAPSHPKPPLTFEEVSPECTDYSRLRHWLSHCCQQHQTCKPIYSCDLQSIRLIDVQVHELVAYPALQHLDYIALSYVWGNVSSESFALGPLPDNLPATIEDAIEVTRQIGKRFLWVDAISIDQRDHSHKANQIKIMDSVYSGAFATIISLNGESADEGLPRVGGKAQSTAQVVVDVGRGNKIGSKMFSLETQLGYSTWTKRAWTFQEGVLSHRRLVFTRHQVYFACNNMICSEAEIEIDEKASLVRLEDLSRYGLANPLLQSTSCAISQPKHQLFRTLINSYAVKRLSFRSDTLNAVSGLLTRLESTCFPEGFLYGLPQSDFRYALIWRVDLQQQLCPGITWCSHRLPACFFPTWSWLNLRWIGPIFWLWKQEDHRCHIPQPPLQIWTWSGDCVKTGIPSYCSCDSPQKEVYAQEFLLADIERTFQQLSSQEHHSSRDSGTKDGSLTMRGVIIRMEIVCTAQTVMKNVYRVELTRNALPHRIDLTKTCVAALGNTWREVYFHLDGPWDQVVHEDTPKEFDFLLVALSKPDKERSRDGVVLHLLMLEWKDDVAFRVGIAYMVVRKWSGGIWLETAKPRMALFTLR